MGIEVKVPEREFKYSVHRLPIYKDSTKELSDNTEDVLSTKADTFDITKLDSNTYQIEDIENLGDALNFFFYKPRPPILSKVIDRTGLDISNGELLNVSEISFSPTNGGRRTVTLKIQI